MKISVLLFASLRERFGTECVVVDLPAGSKAGEIFDHLFRESAEREMWRAAARVAVNQSYVSNDTVLNERDDVALIPPVAGG